MLLSQLWRGPNSWSHRPQGNSSALTLNSLYWKLFCFSVYTWNPFTEVCYVTVTFWIMHIESSGNTFLFSSQMLWSLQLDFNLLSPRSCRWGCRRSRCCRSSACCPHKSLGSGRPLHRRSRTGRSRPGDGWTLAPGTGRPQPAAAYPPPPGRRSSRGTSWWKTAQGESGWCWAGVRFTISSTRRNPSDVTGPNYIGTVP